MLRISNTDLITKGIVSQWGKVDRSWIKQICNVFRNCNGGNASYVVRQATWYLHSIFTRDKRVGRMIYGLVLIDTQEAIVQQVLEDCYWFMPGLVLFDLHRCVGWSAVEKIRLHFPDSSILCGNFVRREYSNMASGVFRKNLNLEV